jgi:hypothetical protein
VEKLALHVRPDPFPFGAGNLDLFLVSDARAAALSAVATDDDRKAPIMGLVIAAGHTILVLPRKGASINVLVRASGGSSPPTRDSGSTLSGGKSAQDEMAPLLQDGLRCRLKF